MTIVLFNQPYTVKKIQSGADIYVYGKLQTRYSRVQMVSPEIFFECPGPYIPVYPLTKGIRQVFLHRLIKTAFQSCRLRENYPPKFLKKIKLPEINEAVRQIHFPESLKAARLARDRLVFDELIVFCKTLEYLEEGAVIGNENKMNTDGLIRSFCSRLSFKPTRAQLKVMGEIGSNLSGNRTMNRLVQGDVGSGKNSDCFLRNVLCASKRIPKHVDGPDRDTGQPAL